jgi:tRNA/tmRNA/rRNA uracil-C5-methylase (TrmA/RlmC/RlmD family)
VARLQGRVIFVRHALPGERVRARITEVRPKSFCRADALEILEADPQRVEPPCRHFHPGGCGGCDFQHASAERQLSLKAAVVAEQLRRLAHIEVDVVVSALPGDGFGWRTRVRWALDDSGRIGPRRYRSHRVEAVSRSAPCLIAAPGLTESAAALDVPAAVRRGARIGSPASRARGDGDRRSGRSRRVPDPEVSLIRVDDSTISVWHGEVAPIVTEQAVGREFAVRADGFWQVHPAAADALASAVHDVLLGLAPEGGTAWDLYGGVGLFAAVLAEMVGPFGCVVNVEGDRDAAALAARNLADLTGASALNGAVESVIDSLPDPAVVVLDPPRAGAGRDVCARIAARRPSVIVYVACDPAALGRDTGALVDAGYRLDVLRAFDCFPQTHHVECVARFVPA